MDTYKGNRKKSSSSSPYNQFDFFVQNLLKNTVNTALPVKVVAVEAGGSGIAGYVDVVPLIQSYDGFGNAIPSQTIFHVPYMRVQGGKAALIIDPVIGDIGLAVFAQQDITGLTDTPKKPLTKRSYSMADALYIGGFLNQSPSIYLELKQDNTAKLICPVSLTVESKSVKFDCDDFQISASNVTVNAPLTTINGSLSAGGQAGASCDINGTLQVTDDVTAGGISLRSHTHTCPDGETSSPN